MKITKSIIRKAVKDYYNEENEKIVNAILKNKKLGEEERRDIFKIKSNLQEYAIHN